MTDFSSHLKKLAAMIGSECVYKEGGLIIHVKIKAINFVGDTLEITMKRLPSIGFGTRPNRTFKIGGVVEGISFDKNRLSFSYVLSPTEN